MGIQIESDWELDEGDCDMVFGTTGPQGIVLDKVDTVACEVMGM